MKDDIQDELIEKIKNNAESYLKLVKDKIKIDSDMETLIRAVYLDASADTFKEIFDMSTAYTTRNFNLHRKLNRSQIN
jgi:hypothetical protein